MSEIFKINVRFWETISILCLISYPLLIFLEEYLSVQYFRTNILLFVGFVSGLIVVFCHYKNEEFEVSKIDDTRMKYLTLILVSAYIFKFYAGNNYLFGGEFHTYFAVEGILSTGLPEMPSGALYLRNMPMNYYLAFFSYFFGSSALVFKTAILTPFLVSCTVLYNLASSMYDRTTAYISIMLVLSSEWLFSVLQFARFYSLLVVALIFFLYFLHCYHQNNEYIHYLIFSGSFLIALTKVGLVVFMFVGFYYLLELVQDSKPINRYSKLIAGLLVVFVSKFAVTGYLSSLQPLTTSSKVSYLDLVADSLSSPSFNDYFVNLFIGNVGIFVLGGLFALFVSLLLYLRSTYGLENVVFNCFFFVILVTASLFSFWKTQPRNLAWSVFLLYLSSASVLTKILNIYLSKKHIKAILVVFMGISFLVIVTNDHNLSYISSTDISEYDISNAAEYVNNNYQSGDIVMSTLVWGWDDAYLENDLDYVIRTKNYRNPAIIINSSSSYRLYYHNTTVLTSSSDFRDVLEKNNRVWVIRHYRTKVNNQKSLLRQLNESELVYRDERTAASVYLFE